MALHGSWISLRWWGMLHVGGCLQHTMTFTETKPYTVHASESFCCNNSNKKKQNFLM